MFNTSKAMIASVLLLASCATSNIPTEKLNSLRGSLRAAQEMGADQNPQAALYLQYAKEAADEAKTLFDAGRNDEATSKLARSEADAQVAMGILRAAEAQNETN